MFASYEIHNMILLHKLYQLAVFEARRSLIYPLLNCWPIKSDCGLFRLIAITREHGFSRT